MKKTELALLDADRDSPRKSPMRFLVIHDANDSRRPTERITAPQERFDKRFALIELEGDGHSTLARSCDRRAFEDAVDAGLRRMTIATLEKKRCEIAAGRSWTTV